MCTTDYHEVPLLTTHADPHVPARLPPQSILGMAYASALSYAGV